MSAERFHVVEGRSRRNPSRQPWRSGGDHLCAYDIEREPGRRWCWCWGWGWLILLRSAEGWRVRIRNKVGFERAQVGGNEGSPSEKAPVWCTANR
jgi:hypothetical protein